MTKHATVREYRQGIVGAIPTTAPMIVGLMLGTALLINSFFWGGLLVLAIMTWGL